MLNGSMGGEGGGVYHDCDVDLGRLVVVKERKRSYPGIEVNEREAYRVAPPPRGDKDVFCMTMSPTFSTTTEHQHGPSTRH